MIFKAQITLTETEMMNAYLPFDKIIPVYKSLNDDLTKEINWTRDNRNMIVGAACEYVWDRYYDEFRDQKILPRSLFYRFIRDTLNCTCKSVRITSDTVKRCFVSKSTS